jgi:hypothetical protein
MSSLNLNATAALVESIHAPWRDTVEGCLSKWAGLDERTRSRAYLVVDTGSSGRKRTFNGAEIANIVSVIG